MINIGHGNKIRRTPKSRQYCPQYKRFHIHNDNTKLDYAKAKTITPNPKKVKYAAVRKIKFGITKKAELEFVKMIEKMLKDTMNLLRWFK